MNIDDSCLSSVNLVQNNESDDEAIYFLGCERSVQVLPSQDHDSDVEVIPFEDRTKKIKVEADESSFAQEYSSINKSIFENDLFIDSDCVDSEEENNMKSTQNDIFVDSPSRKSNDENYSSQFTNDKENDNEDSCIYLQEVPVLEYSSDLLGDSGQEKHLTEESGIGFDESIEVPTCSPHKDNTDKAKDINTSKSCSQSRELIDPENSRSFQNYFEGALDASHDDNFESAFAYIIANFDENNQDSKNQNGSSSKMCEEISDSELFENSVDDINDLLTRR